MTRRRRQRYASPDGIDWRDPNMPVLAPWEDRWGQKTIRAIPPKEEQEFRQYNMEAYNPLKPDWRTDPTYNLAKRARRRKQ